MPAVTSGCQSPKPLFSSVHKRGKNGAPADDPADRHCCRSYLSALCCGSVRGVVERSRSAHTSRRRRSSHILAFAGKEHHHILGAGISGKSAHGSARAMCHDSDVLGLYDTCSQEVRRSSRRHKRNRTASPLRRYALRRLAVRRIRCPG